MGEKVDPKRYLLPMHRSRTARGNAELRFAAEDRDLLGILSHRLARDLPQSPLCTHLKNHGGLKNTVGKVAAQLREAGEGCHVYRTDVKSYYESIDAQTLLTMVERYMRDRDMMRLLVQYLNMSVEVGGTFTDAPQGLRAGQAERSEADRAQWVGGRRCAMENGSPSPILAAFYLYELDRAFEDHPHVFYLRYMDDIIIIARRRWHLRAAIAKVQQHFEALGLVSHPDKTEIGRWGRGSLAQGVTFLGYTISSSELRLSKTTLSRHEEKAHQLYEQVKTKQLQEKCEAVFRPQLRPLKTLARRLFADGETIAICAPQWLKDRAYISINPSMKHPSYINERLRAYEKRFIAWANGGLGHEKVIIRTH